MPIRISTRNGAIHPSPFQRFRAVRHATKRSTFLGFERLKAAVLWCSCSYRRRWRRERSPPPWIQCEAFPPSKTTLEAINAKRRRRRRSNSLGKFFAERCGYSNWRRWRRNLYLKIFETVRFVVQYNHFQRWSTGKRVAASIWRSIVKRLVGIIGRITVRLNRLKMIWFLWTYRSLYNLTYSFHSTMYDVLQEACTRLE